MSEPMVVVTDGRCTECDYAQRLPHGQWLVWDKLAGLESFDSFSDVEVAWRNRRKADRIFGIDARVERITGEVQGEQMVTLVVPVPVVTRQGLCPHCHGTGLDGELGVPG